jgi:hypothetical protein
MLEAPYPELDDYLHLMGEARRHLSKARRHGVLGYFRKTCRRPGRICGDRRPR